MSKKNTFDLQKNIDSLKKEFQDASDRAVAIVAGSFLEELLTEILNNFLVEVENQQDSMSIFSGNDILSSFSSKIKMSFRLGLISKDEHRVLNVIRQIRNNFAHELHDVSFSTQSISDRCKSIETPLKLVCPQIIPFASKDGYLPLPSILKAKSDDPRALFEERVLSLLNCLSVRIIQAGDSAGSTPIDFLLAHEPAEMILHTYKKKAAEYQELLEKREEMLKLNPDATDNDENYDTESNVMTKNKTLFQLQEIIVEQIKRSHIDLTIDN
jgi:hypothetical protein